MDNGIKRYCTFSTHLRRYPVHTTRKGLHTILGVPLNCHGDPSCEVRSGIFHLWHQVGAHNFSDFEASGIWDLGVRNAHPKGLDSGSMGTTGFSSTRVRQVRWCTLPKQNITDSDVNKRKLPSRTLRQSLNSKGRQASSAASLLGWPMATSGCVLM